MDFIEKLTRNRSYRRFYEDRPVSEQELTELIEYTRKVASGANLQPLRYHLSWTAEENARVFETLKWAAYLKDWVGPEKGERPTAYITVLRDTEVKDVSTRTDAGIAMQTILLGAVEKGYGGCIFASIDRKKLRKIIDLDPRYEIVYMIALGVPKEEVVLEDLEADGGIEYYRDEKMVHHVPKRKLEDILL